MFLNASLVVCIAELPLASICERAIGTDDVDICQSPSICFVVVVVAFSDDMNDDEVDMANDGT